MGFVYSPTSPLLPPHLLHTNQSSNVSTHPVPPNRALLARITRTTSTLSFLDAILTITQYSSPIVIALVLRLAKFRADHPRLSLSALRGHSPKTTVAAPLVQFAARMGQRRALDWRCAIHPPRFWWVCCHALH